MTTNPRTAGVNSSIKRKTSRTRIAAAAPMGGPKIDPIPPKTMYRKTLTDAPKPNIRGSIALLSGPKKEPQRAAKKDAMVKERILYLVVDIPTLRHSNSFLAIAPKILPIWECQMRKHTAIETNINANTK